MADSLKDLVELLSRGGPAEGFKAASQGFAQGQQAQALSKEERRKRLQEEVSRLTGGEVNKLIGEDLVRPELQVPVSELGSLANLRQRLQPPAAADTVKAQAELDLVKARTKAALQSAESSKLAREQADRRLAQTEEAPKRAAQQKALKDLQDAEAAGPKLMAAINSVRQAAADLPVVKPGVFNQAIGRGKLAVKEFAKDPAVEKYLGVVSQNLAPLARGLAEEKGPLTDPDIARIQTGLGELSTPPATREALLQELIDKVNRSIEVRRRNTGSLPTLPDQPADVGGLTPDEQAELEQLRAELGGN